MDQVITNKYSNNITFSGNICNGICKFDFYANDVTVVSGVGEVDFGEKPYEVSNKFGCALNVQSSEASTTIDIEGFDYLGQPIIVKAEAVTSTAKDLDIPFKYITKIKVATGTVTVKESMLKAFPEFKMTKLLSVTKNGADIALPTLTAPVVTKNVNGKNATRGKITLTASNGDHFEIIGIANNSSVTIDGEVVGGLYGNPSVIE